MTNAAAREEFGQFSSQVTRLTKLANFDLGRGNSFGGKAPWNQVAETSQFQLDHDARFMA